MGLLGLYPCFGLELVFLSPTSYHFLIWPGVRYIDMLPQFTSLVFFFSLLLFCCTQNQIGLVYSIWRKKKSSSKILKKQLKTILKWWMLMIFKKGGRRKFFVHTHWVLSDVNFHANFGFWFWVFQNIDLVSFLYSMNML